MTGRRWIFEKPTTTAKREQIAGFGKISQTRDHVTGRLVWAVEDKSTAILMKHQDAVLIRVDGCDVPPGVCP